MKRQRFIFICGFVLCFLSVSIAMALTEEQMERLREAGIEDRIIQKIIDLEKKDPDLLKGQGVKEVTRPDGRREKIYFSVGSPEEEKTETQEKEQLEKAWEVLRNILIDVRQRRP